MNIDRHNYEEYFILYVDNELGSEDRRRVEAFVQLHPDLQEELDMLLQAKLEPDHVVYDGKEELLMFNGAPSAINENNYEEWLVLYIDNELDTEQRQVVEAYASHHPAVKNELALLLQTRLQPETIVFPDKKSLYRKEERTRRIGWWKIAAAAVLLAAIATTTVLIVNRNNTTKPVAPEIAATPGKQQQPEQKIPVTIPEATDKQEQTDKTANPVIDNATGNTLAKTGTADRIIKKSMKQEDQKQQRVVTPKEEEEKLYAVNDVTTNQPSSINDPVRDAMMTNKAIINELAQPALTKSTNSDINPAVTTIASKTSIIIDRSILDTDEPNDGKKGGLRGFVRKVTRTFEKNTRINATDDDDRLLVGGLAIKL